MLTGNLFFLQPNLAHSSGFYRQFSTKDLPSRQTGSELGNAIFFPLIISQIRSCDSEKY